MSSEGMNTTVETAFEDVKGHLVKIGYAARNGDLAKIDQIYLGDAFKWKVAFLYYSD